MSKSRIPSGSMKRRDEDGEDGRGWRRAERRHRIKSWFATPFNRREGHSSQLGGKGSDSDAWDHDEVAVAIHHASEEFQLKADALQPHQTARASAASKAQDIKNVSTPRISNVPDDGPIGVPRDCWSIARERFIRDDANLWNLFEAVLFKTTVMDVNRDFGSSRPPEEMMREVIKLQLAKINSRRWRLRIPLRSKPAEVRSLVERLAIFAPVTKAAWSTCQLDPITSGLPLAALLVLIEFIGNEKQESEALVKGIAATGDILCLYLLVEGRLMAYEFGELRTKCKEALINLYVAVLRFLANAACHLNRNTAWRIADGATRFSDWEGQLRELEEKRQRFEAFAGALEREATSQYRERVEKTLGEARQRVEKIADDIESLKKENEKLIDWVSSVDVQAEHYTVREKMGRAYADSSGEWLQSRFDEWMDSDKPVYWLAGSAGRGKSSLMSCIIERHSKAVALKTDQGFAYFYCIRNNGTTPLKVLSSLVAQLAWSVDGRSVSESIRSRHDAAPKQRLSQQDCVELISEDLTAGYKAITFCIDALDECDHVDSLLINLREIHKTLSTRCRVKLMVSSRRDVTVGNSLALDFEMLDLDNPSLKLTKLELSNFVRTQVLERESLGIGARLLNGQHRMLEESLVDAITWQSQGMFLWAKLQLAMFFPSRPINTPEEVEERIRKLGRSGGDGLTPDLNLVYDQIYMANTTWDRTIASRAYKIILGAYTGMSMECLAAAIRYRSSSTHDEYESINPDLIQRICGNFLVKDQNDIVTFAHQSVREYLLQRPGAEYSPFNVHAQLATSCLWLLNRHLLKSVDGSFGQGIGPRCQPSLDPHASSSEDGDPEADLARSSRPLLLRGVYDLSGKVLDFDSLFGYASICWAGHFSNSGLKNRVSGGVLDLLLKQFITGEDKDKWSGNSSESTPFTRWQGFINSLKRGFENLYDPLRDAGSAIDPPNPVVLVTIWGLTEVFDHITPELPVFGYQTSRGMSLLALAAKHGKGTSVLSNLIDRGAGIDEINNRDGQTAIHTAATYGNNDAVRFFLDRQANLKIRGPNCDANLLVDAARECSSEVFEALLEKCYDDEDVYEALVSACGSRGHNNVSRMLARLTPDTLGTWLKGQPDGGAFTIQQAAAAGNTSAVTTLVEAGATIDLTGEDWTTPLQLAAKLRDVEMFSTLLKKIPHLETPDIALGSTLRCVVWEAISLAARTAVYFLDQKRPNTGLTDPYIHNVRLLLGRGVNLNATGRLHIDVHSNNPLLDTEPKDIEGTALDIARLAERHFNMQNGQIAKEFVDFLLEHGAVSSRDLDLHGNLERHGSKPTV